MEKKFTTVKILKETLEKLRKIGEKEHRRTGPQVDYMVEQYYFSTMKDPAPTGKKQPQS